jgi:hypothetical protein
MHIIRDTKTVHDKVTFCAGDEKLTLRVDKDARLLVAELNGVHDKLQEVTEENLPEKIDACARAFAEAVFGTEQAEKMLALYHNPVSVINVLEQYFRKYLQKKITRAQVR